MLTFLYDLNFDLHHKLWLYGYEYNSYISIKNILKSLLKNYDWYSDIHSNTSVIK